jgi:hypothetical protein
MIFLTKPISASLLALAVVALIGPKLWAMMRKA